MAGWIDIHSHLIPGVDDGCDDLDASLECIAMLKAHGFAGSICTPHLWPPCYPKNDRDAVEQWTAWLRRELAERVIDYQIWPGGELRLFKGAIRWMKERGVPTLAGSNCVLVDTWDGGWPEHVFKIIDWLAEGGYQVILAHPERSAFGEGYDRAIAWMIERGVWLQGNFNPLTGWDLPGSREQGWTLLQNGRYRFLGLDMHGPRTLPSRLDGMREVRQALGEQALQTLARENPRRLILEQGTT